MAFSRLTVFLLREGCGSPSDYVRTDKGAIEVPLAAGFGTAGSAFYVPSSPGTPEWVSELNSVLSAQIANVRSASASGVLILSVSSRWFAVSFGYGRSLIDPALIQRQFGLRVGLNLIDPAQLRSLDTKTFEDLVVSKSTQSSKSSDLPAFGVDISRDILRGVSGVPQDLTFAARLAGSDSIALVREAGASELPKICEALLDAYASDAYKENFGWIDHLSIVEDPVVEDSLNSKLISALQCGDTSTTYMAAPEAIDWEDIESFTINGTRDKIYDDLDLDEYLGEHSASSLASLSLSILKQRGVTVKYSRSQQTDRLWNVYQCLISEQHLGSQLYVLIEGKWFEVDQTLSSRVDRYFASLPSSSGLIAAAPGETEPEYNLRVARENPSEYLHLDAKIVRPGGASSGIEFCYLLGSDGTLVHVKRKSRSATLSHLFAQGTVSAVSLLGDPEFRVAIRQAIDKKVGVSGSHWLDLIPDENSSVTASNYRISYVVLTKPLRHRGGDWMPFFSKLNLMQHATRLRSMNFEVTISRLDN